MKKITAFLFFLLFSSCVFADIDNIVFFGDSLTDNGNLYRDLLHIMPKSPPYFQGRFSNGYVWSDLVAQKFPKSDNYAVGGATAILRDPFAGFLPYEIDEEVTSYILNPLKNNPSTALCVVWIGANDYLSGQSDVAGSTAQVVNEIGRQITRLVNVGINNFLILNLPDMSKAPYAQGVSYAENLHDLTVAHNQDLAVKVSDLQSQFPNVKFNLYDIYSLFNDMETNVAKYNAQYHTNLTNTSDACWTGSYTVPANKQQAADKSKLTATLKALHLKDTKQNALTDTEVDSLAKHILNSPALNEAYQVGQAYEKDVQPCSTPDQYAFWDHVHPSAVTHQILAQIIENNLMQTHMLPTTKQ